MFQKATPTSCNFFLDLLVEIAIPVKMPFYGGPLNLQLSKGEIYVENLRPPYTVTHLG